MSSHLSSYFNNNVYNNNIIEYGRQDFPELLLNNRIIELISKPIEEREKLTDLKQRFEITREDDEGKEIIESVISSDGVRFERFNLQLPKNI